MFRFHLPLLLWVLGILPLLFFYELGRKKGFIFYSSLSLLKETPSSKSRILQLPFLLRLGAIGLLILALARPQIFNSYTEVESSGVDIILAVDTSRSMSALDFEKQGEPIDRLSVVKEVVSDFIKKRVSDRIGMVIFGSMAYTQCPLTLDYGVVQSFLDQVEIGVAGDATALGDGLALSVKRLKDLPSKSKVAILLTDGVNTAGRITPEKAAELAVTYGVKVYTIGVGGGAGSAVIPIRDTLGFTRYMRLDSDLDEETLRKISDQTGGQYFRATDTQGLKKIYETIDKLEKSEAKVKHYQEYRELFRYFIGGGFLLLMLEVFLRETVLRKFP